MKSGGSRINDIYAIWLNWLTQTDVTIRQMMMSVVSLSAGFLNNFEKHAAVNTTVEYSYDHSSVMHYGSRFFRLVLFLGCELGDIQGGILVS